RRLGPGQAADAVGKRYRGGTAVAVGPAALAFVGQRVGGDLGRFGNGHAGVHAAAKSFEQARMIQEKLVAAHPEVTQYQSALARTYLNLGILQSDTRQPAAALKFSNRGWASLRHSQASTLKTKKFEDTLSIFD